MALYGKLSCPTVLATSTPPPPPHGVVLTRTPLKSSSSRESLSTTFPPWKLSFLFPPCLVSVPVFGSYDQQKDLLAEQIRLCKHSLTKSAESFSRLHSETHTHTFFVLLSSSMESEPRFLFEEAAGISANQKRLSVVTQCLSLLGEAWIIDLKGCCTD